MTSEALSTTYVCLFAKTIQCLQRTTVVSAAPGSLEEKLAALEKSKDYTTGMNNLTADNVDLPNRSNAVNIG